MRAKPKRLSLPLRTWIAALAVCAAALAVSAPAAPALPRNFWGVVPQGPPTLEQFQRLKRGGVEGIRVPVGWGVLQPTRNGPFLWEGLDELVRGAVRARLSVLPFLSGAPEWAVAVDRRYGSPATLPTRSARQRSGWRRFVMAAVERYGPEGDFWRENPTLPERPFRTWQIWNEENFQFFVARPNPTEYGRLVKHSFAAIRAVDPGAKLILGGMFARPREATFRRRPPLAYFAADFLDRMYKGTPGIKSKFHGVALHPYTGRYQRLRPYIEDFLAVLKAHRDAGKTLWLTELGWSSQPPSRGNSFAKGRAGQAAQLKGAFRLLLQNQRRWRLASIYWFSVDDQEGACNFCDGSGLFGQGFKPKPAWFAYARFAGGRP